MLYMVSNGFQAVDFNHLYTNHYLHKNGILRTTKLTEGCFGDININNRKVVSAPRQDYSYRHAGVNGQVGVASRQMRYSDWPAGGGGWDADVLCGYCRRRLQRALRLPTWCVLPVREDTCGAGWWCVCLPDDGSSRQFLAAKQIASAEPPWSFH